MLNTIVKLTGAALLLAALHVHAHTPAHKHPHDSSHDASHNASADQPAQHAAHIHGVANLQIAVEGERVYLALTAPADTLLGFDGEPLNEQQQAQAQTVQQLLNEPLRLWGVPADANCLVEATELTWPTAAQLAAHVNIAIEWQLTCDAKLSFLSLELWQQFSGLETLQVELVTDTGAQALELTRADKRVELR